MRKFRLALDLTGGHQDDIHALKFSPCGSYLASGGDDGIMVIWRVSDGAPLFSLRFESAVTALVWHLKAKGIIFCGCHNGSVFQLKNFTAVCLLLTLCFDTNFGLYRSPYQERRSISEQWEKSAVWTSMRMEVALL
jgi:WD40 repeat protein